MLMRRCFCVLKKSNRTISYGMRDDFLEKPGKTMKWPKLIRFIDYFILFCLCVLVIFLPIAHTESIRAFSLGIPAGLWIIKMILTRRLLFSRTPLDLPILLFSVIAGLSVITAVDWKYSLGEFIGEWLIGICLFYLVVNNIRPEQVKYILGALLLGNILMVGYGIFEFFRDGGQVLNYATRAGSLHSGVGTFSTYLVTIIPYIFIAVFFLNKTSYRVTIFILLFLNLFVLLLTFSRGSWVAIIVLALLAGWKFAPRKVFIPSLLIIVGLIILLGAPQKLSQYYDRFTDSNAFPDSYRGRWIVAKFYLERIQDNPLQMLGFGQRSFVKKHVDFYKKYEKPQLWHAHNTFLNIAVQTGLQGLLIFCFLLYRLLKYCYEIKVLEKHSLTGYFSLATFLMIITFFFRNLSDDFFIDDSALLFWFLPGIVFAPGKGELDKKHGVG
jgi:O-antigen ligase